MASIESRGRNRYRIGVRLPVSAGTQARLWVRRTIELPPGLSQTEQAERLRIEAMRLEVDVADGRATPDNPYGVPDGQLPAQPVRPSRTARTAAHATILPAADAQLLHPMICPNNDMTVQRLYDIWMRDHVVPSCTPVTASGYRYLFESRILPEIGDTKINDLSPLYLTRVINDIADCTKTSQALPPEKRARVSDRAIPQRATGKLSARTVRNYYDVMNYMFDRAVAWNLIFYNPLSKVPRPKVRKKRMTIVDDDKAVELLRQLAEHPNIYFRAAVLLALLCGLRLGEVCALRIDDIDWELCRIDITRALKYTSETGQYIDAPKSDASIRMIDLPAGMMVVLHEIRDYQLETAKLLGPRWRGDGRIIASFDGTPLHHDTPSHQWRKFADSHGYKGMRFHDLRHSHATILLSSNVDVVAVAARLGHSTPDTTLRFYAHAVRKRDLASAQAMQDLIQRAGDDPDGD